MKKSKKVVFGLVVIFSATSLLGCSVRIPEASCTMTVTNTTDALGTKSEDRICKCLCPPYRQNIFDFGGMVGGLTNLWSSND